MSPLSLRALYRGLRKHSLTASLIFAAAALGVSIASETRSALRALGIGGVIGWTAAFALIALLAKHEHKLPIGARFRKLASIGLILGSISIGLSLHYYKKALQSDLPDDRILYQKESDEKARRTGPPGKR